MISDFEITKKESGYANGSEKNEDQNNEDQNN